MNVCPECDASVRPDAPWCTLCYHDLRRRPVESSHEPVAGPADQHDVAFVVGPQVALPLPRSAPEGAQSEPSTAAARWPCTRCGAGNDFADATCAACGADFLADVPERGGMSLRLPVVGDLARLPKAASYALAGGFAILVVLVVALLSLVV